ncbi:hypothetical protein GPD67_003662 [Salmonella enterica]|nr:hypothetical protein [Salmonella enterica]EFS4370620.1 hypothetical protein [Salmonella enterica]EIL0605924.1 hypothetical protein [Salmonella enterica]ELP9051052.1 hypothetical protein [Salmonella enterica]
MNNKLFRLVGSVTPVVMSILFISAATAQSSETEFIVRIKANETCSVTSDKNVSLGFVPPNTTKKASPFAVTVTCPGPAPTYVWAKHVNGKSVFNAQVNMEIDGTAHLYDKGTIVQLLEYGYPMDLTGLGERDPDFGFCGGNETRTCNVEPRIHTGSNAVLGKGTVTIRFNLTHT